MRPSTRVAIPGRIIAAVFETAQPLDQPRRDRLLGDDADDAAHQLLPPQPRPDLGGAARLVDLPGAGDRQRIGRHIAGDDAAGRDMAPSPTVTGATSAVFEPINAPSPIIVRHLLTPS